MKKSLFLFLLILFQCVCIGSASAVEQCTENLCPVKISTPLELQNNIAKEKITALVKKSETLQNKHNISALKKVYAEDFVNTDGYKREQLFSLMKKTFENYPDLKSAFEIQNIVVNDDYAMVFLKQEVNAVTKTASKITKDKGAYSAVLYSILYLRKINEEWKVYSENVTYESSKLAYGIAKNIQASVNAPQKVAAGADYCAGVNVVAPIGVSAIASVNNVQIVEGFNLSGETFRQVPPEKGIVERVLKSNDDNNNEAVVVSIGFTQTGEDMFKKPKVDIAGLIMLMKRVDIIPVNSNATPQKDEKRGKK